MQLNYVKNISEKFSKELNTCDNNHYLYMTLPDSSTHCQDKFTNIPRTTLVWNPLI